MKNGWFHNENRNDQDVHRSSCVAVSKEDSKDWGIFVQWAQKPGGRDRAKDTTVRLSTIIRTAWTHWIHKNPYVQNQQQQTFIVLQNIHLKISNYGEKKKLKHLSVFPSLTLFPGIQTIWLKAKFFTEEF